MAREGGRTRAFKIPRRVGGADGEKQDVDGDDDTGTTTTTTTAASSLWHADMSARLEKEYRRFLFLGARIRVSYDRRGCCGPREGGEHQEHQHQQQQPHAVRSLSLVRCAPDPSAVRLALEDILLGGTMDPSVVMARSMEEAREALELPDGEQEGVTAAAVVVCGADGGDDEGGGGPSSRAWSALSFRERRTRLVRRIQGVAEASTGGPRQRPPHIRRAEIQLLRDMEERGTTTTATTNSAVAAAGQRSGGDSGGGRRSATPTVAANTTPARAARRTWKLTVPTPVPIAGGDAGTASFSCSVEDNNHNSHSSQQHHHSRRPSLSGEAATSPATTMNMTMGQQTNLPTNLPEGAVESARGRLSRLEYLSLKKEPQTKYFLQRLKDFIGDNNDNGSSSSSRHDDKHDEHAEQDVGDNNNCDDAGGTTLFPSRGGRFRPAASVAQHHQRRQQRRRRPYHVMDVGGGRGDLATRIALAYQGDNDDDDACGCGDDGCSDPADGGHHRTLDDDGSGGGRKANVVVTVVDKNVTSLLGGQAHARQLGLTEDRIGFVHADFADYRRRYIGGGGGGDCDGYDRENGGVGGGEDGGDQLPGWGLRGRRVDMVVALHACGDLSDLALDFAGAVGADFMVCPCCYTKRYIGNFEPAWCQYVVGDGTGGGFDANNNTGGGEGGGAGSVPNPRGTENDGGTGNDGGKTVPCSRWSTDSVVTTSSSSSSLPSSLDVTLGRLAEMDNRPEVSRRAQNIINSMRMATLQERYDVSLESFPGDCSKRNTVLVGTLRRKR